MKNKLFLIAFLLLFLTGGILTAQEQSTELKLSLKEAQAYAIEHNKMVITSKMDVAGIQDCFEGDDNKYFTPDKCIRKF